MAHVAVDRLRERAKLGESRAQGALVHYGLDLFDFSRLTGDGASRTLLWHLVGLVGAPGRGREATLLVLRRLRAMVRAWDGRGVWSPGTNPHRSTSAEGATARVQLLAILRSDEAFLERRQALPARVRLLHKILRGPLRYSVLLRLYAPCAQAFRAAALAPAPARGRILNYCLYCLYSIDPSPHLSKARRAVDPPWTAYRQGLSALLKRVEASSGRAAAIGARLSAMDERFFREQAHRLPLPLGEWVHLLPMISGGRAVRPGPEVLRLRDRFLAGGQVVSHPQPRHIRVALSRMFFAYGKRTHLTLYAPRGMGVARLRGVLERAADVGFYTVGLGGRRPLRQRVGYWRLTDAHMVERREVVLSLAPSSAAARVLASLTPEQISWDWRCTTHQLMLVLRADGVVVAGPDGQLPAEPAAGDLPNVASAALHALWTDFPGECGLALAAGPDLTFGQLVAVVERLRREISSRAGSFRYLGYRISGPKTVAGGGPFAARVARRRRARVSVQGLSRRAAARVHALKGMLRACYLSALDRSPDEWAVLRVQPAGGRFLVSQQKGSAVEDISLFRCVEQAVKEWAFMAGSGGSLLRPLEVELRLSRPEPTQK